MRSTQPLFDTLFDALAVWIAVRLIPDNLVIKIIRR
jgi:hypothetical protein